MDPQAFFQAVQSLSLPIDEHKMDQFETYYHTLVEWNEKMNLTAITDKEEVYLKHFYDSLTLATLETFDPKASLCDVGSGAGFPSLPLKIIYPQLKVSIVDSLNKRIRFLGHLIETLGLDQVDLYHSRAEDFGQDKNHRAIYDRVTARAVARMSVLTELCLPLVKKGGLFLAMKASGGAEEIAAAQKAIATLGGKYIEDVSFDLPQQAGERHIYVIEKRKESPNKYPRQAGTPNKKPIE